MTIVVGIRFKDSGKTYYFDPRDLELRQGEYVIVETVRGFEMAKVAYERREVSESELVGELKPVVRHAEPADFDRMHLLHSRHAEVLERCAEKVREHNLPMNLVKAEYSFDGSRLTFYFTSEKRVDFRMLVRDLARTFKSRIELRQIGPRDEAKLLGGIGPCGRLLCCATFLPDYARVSIKMAKDQDLPLNPAKISGVCGRLLCCLSYEHEQYVEMRAELPRKGAWVQTPDGPGEVVSVNVIKQQVTVQLASSGMQELYDRTQIQEATEKVGTIARSRVEEGIAPVARNNRRDPSGNGERGGRDRGERRLLRDDIDHSDILDALALLEEGDPDLADYAPSDDASPRRSQRSGPARPPRGAPEGRTPPERVAAEGGDGASARRSRRERHPQPQPAERRAPELANKAEAAPAEQSTATRSSAKSRRRRRRDRGEAEQEG